MKAAVIAMSALECFGSLWPVAVRADGPDLPAVLVDNDAASRMRALDSCVKNLRSEDVPAALKQAIAGHGPGRDDAIDALSGRWVEFDAPAALAFARQTSDRESRDSIETAYYGAWADRDPEGALKAAPPADAGERADAIWQIAHKIGQRDPQRANELIKSIHSASFPDSDYYIFWSWAGKNLGQATQTLLQEAKVAGYSYPCETAVWAITDRLLEDDPQAAAKWAAQLPAGPLYDEAFERLNSEWGKMDREAVAAWLKSLPGSDQVRNAILNLPKQNAGESLLRVKLNPSFAQKAEQLHHILWDSNDWHEIEALLPFVDGLTANEFPQAMECLRNAPDSNRAAVVDVLVARWSKVDPAGAIKAISMAGLIHDNEFRDRFLSDVYAAWSQRDPEAAFASATRNDHDVGNYAVLRVIFAVMARQNPVHAYAAFQKLKDANSQLLVTPIFTEWAVHDLPAATQALSTEPGWQGAIEGMVIGLMRRGPAAAIAWAGHLSAKPYRDQALQDVALRWPDDPAAAAAWLEKGPDFDGKNNAFDDVAVDWAVRDPLEALRHAATLPDGNEKDSLLNWGLTQWTYDDVEAAQQYARQLPGDEAKKHALAIVLDTWGGYAPAAAATYLSSMANEVTPSDVAGIAASFSDGDPVSAVHWLDTLPASLDKAPAIGKISENWYRKDSSAAEAWVHQMPAGPLYDAGAQGICESLNGNLPVALKWARSIGNAKIRHDEVYQAFAAATYPMRYAFNDTAGIKNKIQGAAELTDADKKTLMARLPVLVESRDPQPFQKPSLPAN